MTFAELAAAPDPALEELALALAAEFGPVDADAARAELDRLAATVTAPTADGLVAALQHFAGDTEHYDDPVNSMLPAVLERRQGLPILLSAVYIAVGRRAGIAVDGIGLPGHFVVAVGDTLLDPFGRGRRLDGAPPAPWPPKDIALRMLNNLVGSHQRRGDLANALRAAELRTLLPGSDATAEAELRAMQARLN